MLCKIFPFSPPHSQPTVFHNLRHDYLFNIGALVIPFTFSTSSNSSTTSTPSTTSSSSPAHQVLLVLSSTYGLAWGTYFYITDRGRPEVSGSS